LYKLTSNGIKNIETCAWIPNNPKNPDWCKYQAWLKEGNKPEPEFTKEELAVKKQSNIKMKESELVQVQMQFDIATAKGFLIASDYEIQLNKLESELSKLKK